MPSSTVEAGAAQVKVAEPFPKYRLSGSQDHVRRAGEAGSSRHPFHYAPRYALGRQVVADRTLGVEYLIAASPKVMGS